MIVINPDAHSEAGLDDLEYGVSVARRGWLTKADVANTGSLATVSRRIAEFRSRVS
jgi:DNA polymerase (family 10)